MKKLLKYLLLFLLIISCAKEDNSEVEDLSAQISALNEQISSLQSQISSLTSNNSNLSSQLSDAQSQLEAAQTALASSDANLSEITEKLEDVTSQLSSVDYSQVKKLNATGNVSDQTAEEAKKTIYGRWNVTPSSSKSFSSKRFFKNKSKQLNKFITSKKACVFDFIEFNDENYLMSIYTGDYYDSVFGEYIFEEDSNGKVVSVDLMFDIGISSVRIARLTNIVVTETAGNINATFDVEMDLPDDLVSCNTLSGSYSAPKEDPVPESETATALSNHGKLIGEWLLVEFSSTSSDGSDDITYDDLFSEYCLIYDESTELESIDPNCTEPNKVLVNFSDFGTYTIVFLYPDGSVAEMDYDKWSWANNDQTKIYVSEEMDDVYDIEITDTSLTFRGSYYDDYYEITYTDVLKFERN